jgi:hypothetical protein
MRNNRELQVNKILGLFHLLKNGNKEQVTKLLSLEKLLTSEHQCFDYYLFLVERAQKYNSESKSLSKVEIVNNDLKSELLEEVFAEIKALRENEGMITHGKKLIDFYHYFQALSPGWKRISIHASRRKLEDPDLILLEQTVRYCLNHWYSGKYAYYLSQYFCCSYEKYRLFLTPESSCRVHDIANYFSEN